jgi:hypothetical protein
MGHNLYRYIMGIGEETRARERGAANKRALRTIVQFLND